MGRRDGLSAAGLAALAIAYLVTGRRYPLDTLAAPGPGVFPLAVGLLLLALAAAQAVGALHTGARAAPDPLGPRPGRALALAAVLGGYVAGAGALGFLPASFALVLLSSRILGARGWLRPLVLAAAVTVAIHLLFVVWLGVPLPRGPFR